MYFIVVRLSLRNKEWHFKKKNNLKEFRFEEGKYKENVEAHEKILEQFADVHRIKECIGNCYFKQKK